jgi:hypothetical protein
MRQSIASKVGKSLFTLAVLLLLISVALAQSSDGVSARISTGYDLSWWTVDGGGGKTSDDGYILMGTIGQLDAGPVLSSGGYTLIGGFWPGALTQYRIYLPVVLKNP